MSLPVLRCVVAAVCFSSMAAAATVLAPYNDRVLLKNGDRITGHILTTTADFVSLETQSAGTISVRREAIQQVLSGSANPASHTAQRDAAKPESAAQTFAIAALPSDPPATPCLEHLRPVPLTWAVQFQGAPNQVVVGTVSEDLFGAGLSVSSCEGSTRNQTTFVAAGTHSRFYERRSGAITADVADATLEQQHFFRSTQGMAFFVVADAFNNNALGMAMQKSAGIGLLSRQYRYKAAAYDVAGDIRYLNQHLDGVSPVLNLASVRLKEQIHFQGTLFRLDEQAWIMPSLNDTHALQAYASFAPSVSLKPWLTLGISEEESYLENAPYPRNKNYFTSALTLTLQGSSSDR